MVREGKGKFRFDNKKAKTGRLSIPAKIVTDSLFPLSIRNTVKITLTEKGYLIAQPMRAGIIDNPNVETITVCRSRDCKHCNKSNSVCMTNHEITKSGCLTYVRDMTFLNKGLKENISHMNIYSHESRVETVKTLNDINDKINRKFENDK